MLYRNTASQKIQVFLANISGTPIENDTRIICHQSIDWGSVSQLTDTNPVPVTGGYYLFDLTQAETNGHVLSFYPQYTGTTSNLSIIPTPAVVYTNAPNYDLFASGNVVDAVTNAISSNNLTSGDVVNAVTNSITTYGVSTLTAAQARVEMDTNSVQLAYISGAGGASAAAIRAEIDANSAQLAFISGAVGGIPLTSGNTVDAVSTALTSYGASTLTVGNIDANSLQLAYISGNIGGSAPTVTQIRQELDANSVQFAYISGNIGSAALTSGNTVDAAYTALALYGPATAIELAADVNTLITNIGSPLQEETNYTITAPTGTLTPVSYSPA